MRKILSEHPVSIPDRVKDKLSRVMREGRCRGACLPGQ
jgi:hypothetical protein